MRYLDPTLHAEMMSELRWPGEAMELGLDVRTLDLDKTDLAKLAVARRADVMEQLAAWTAAEPWVRRPEIASRRAPACWW